MKITFDREKFQTAFQTAAMVAPSRSPKPILQNVKLDATEKATILMATDMEIGVRIEVEGIEVEQPGSMVLPVARFGSILKEVRDERLSVQREESRTVVQAQHSKFTLSSEDPDEFPTVQTFAEGKYHEVSARVLKELIRRTLFATDTESGRYALGGVLLELGENSITAVATDGRRLAKMEGPATQVEGHGNTDAMTIIPSRAMQLIERSLTDLDATVQIASRTNDVLVKVGPATIYARLVEGRFPKWRDVLPEKREAAHIEMSVGPAYAALRQAAIVTSDESRGIDFTFGHGSMVLSSNTAEVGDSRVEIPIPYDGENVEITMDHRFVADFYKVLGSESNFTLNIQNAESAALFSTDDNYDYVVMPLARDRQALPISEDVGQVSTWPTNEINGITNMSQRQPGKLQSIKGTLAQLMVQKGYAQVQTADATQKAWDVAAGERLAEHSVAGNVQRGTLLVMVANSTISQMISFQKPKILKSLQEQLPDHGITDLKIKVGRID